MDVDTLPPPLTQPAPQTIAQHLLTAYDEARPAITFAVIAALKQMVDETKHQDPAQAAQIAEIAVRAAATLADPLAEALASWASGAASVFLFQLPKAQDAYQHAAAIYRTHAAWRDLVNVQAPLVYVLTALGDHAGALALADEARPRCLALGQEGLQALGNLEMNVGTLYIQQGKYQESLAACDRASTACRQLGDEAWLGRININRANVYQEMDRYGEAESCYQAARHSLLQSAQNRQQVALVDLNLGLLAIRRGAYLQALQHLEAARSGFIPLVHLAWVDFNRALVYNRLNLNAETFALAGDAIAILNEQGAKRELAMAYHVQASAALRLGQTEEAQQRLQQARHYFQEYGALAMVAQIDLAQAEVHLQLGQVESAQRLLTATKEQIRAEQWPNLAVQHALLAAEYWLMLAPPQIEEALAAIEQALLLLGEYGDARLSLRAQRLLGRAYEMAGDRERAWHAYLRAIATVQRLRRGLQLDEFQIGFVDDQWPIFQAAAGLLVAQEQGELEPPSRKVGAPQSQEISDSATWQPEDTALPQLLYLLALATTPPTLHRSAGLAAASADQLEQLHTLRADWHWQQSKMEQLFASSTTSTPVALPALQQRQEKIEREMADLWRRIGTQDSSIDLPDINLSPNTFAQQALRFAEQLQATLAANESLVQFFLAHGQISVLLVKRSSITLHRLGAAGPVEQALRAWRHHLRDLALITHQPTLAQQVAQRPLRVLYQQLIAPLEAALNDCAHLKLMFPPTWHDLPIAALITSATAPQAHYLIERWSITQLSSLEGHLVARDANLAPAALIVGYSQQGQLPNALSEARLVAAELGPDWQVHILLEEEATVERLLAAISTSDLLHLASHALFRPDNPLFSWLQLADGRLSVAELYHQARLERRPLVVLSACETGRGGQGSGLVGLARALLAIGAGGLIAAQWRVEDGATMRLMQRFYQGWRFGKSPHEALQLAQRALLQELHPFYWAGFVSIR